MHHFVVRLTPAPITPGSFSSPTLNSMPTDRETIPTRATVMPVRSQKGVLTSFFWQVLPPQKVLVELPSFVGRQKQEKQTDLPSATEALVPVNLLRHSP